MRLRLVLSLACSMLQSTGALEAQDAADSKANALFESKIRPLLEKTAGNATQAKTQKQT